MNERSENVALPTETLGGNLPTYNMVYDRSLHQYTMVAPDEGQQGEWVKMEDVRNHLMPFISGYLMEHGHMLEANKVHPKIVAAVVSLKKMVDQL